MKEIKYVVRFFKQDEYLYSVHCSAQILDDVVSQAKDCDMKVKILAYEDNSESEV